MSIAAFVEILEQLPFERRREVYDYLQYIYQKSQEADEGDLNEMEIKELQERREAYLKKPASGIALNDAKKRLLGKN